MATLGMGTLLISNEPSPHFIGQIKGRAYNRAVEEKGGAGGFREGEHMK